MITSWLSRLQSLAVETRATLAVPDAMLLDLFGASPVTSGVTVTPENAMRCTAVRAAVEAIAEAVGVLPCVIYERAASGALSAATAHPAYPLLLDAANDWTAASRFLEQLTRDALLHGNGYAFINRVNGEPRELIRLRPETVQVRYHLETGEPLYHVSNGEDQRDIARQDVLHLMAPSIDGIAGVSPVIMCREAIGLAIVLEAHAARLFGQGGRPSGILKFPNKLGAETAKRIKQSWQAAHTGANAGQTAVIEEGGDFKALAFSSVDAQFLEIWQHAINEIARVFRVPPSLIFEMGRATWSNASEMGASFLKFTLARWLKAWEGEINLKLIAPGDRSRVYARFDTDDLLRADLPARANAYAQLIAARVLNPNECRELEDRAPYAGGDAFINPNTTPNAGGANAQ